MRYLIDGHNLIPKLGWKLDALDDEMRLVEWLQAFCRGARTQVEVYFDRAPAGRSGTQRFGNVTAHFVREGLPADEAIIRRVIQMGKTAGNCTVVTSDRRIQTNVKASHGKVISSEAFVELAREALAHSSGKGQTGGLSTNEVNEWMDLFRGKKEKNS